MLWAIMVEVLGAYEETYKTYLHPINDLEQEGPWKLPPLSLKIDTLIRTTGREIGFWMQSPNPKNLTIPFKPTVLEKFFFTETF